MTDKSLYEFHPACLLYPNMDPETFMTLRSSIGAGYDPSHPILLFEGKILDGRHRYLACQAEGVDPVYAKWDDGNPYNFAWRENGVRRAWLSQEQKALVGIDSIDFSGIWDAEKARVMDAANQARSESAKAQHEVSNPRIGELKPFLVAGQVDPPPEMVSVHPSRDSKAATLGVNSSAIKRAETIKRHDPELANQVKRGEVKSGKALTTIKHKKLEEKLKVSLAAQEATQPIIKHQSAVDFLTSIADQSVDLLLTDPPYSTDVEDIAAFVSTWLHLALSKIKPTGRAYICAGAYPHEVHAYLTAKADIR